MLVQRSEASLLEAVSSVSCVSTEHLILGCPLNTLATLCHWTFYVGASVKRGGGVKKLRGILLSSQSNFLTKHLHVGIFSTVIIHNYLNCLLLNQKIRIWEIIWWCHVWVSLRNTCQTNHEKNTVQICACLTISMYCIALWIKRLYFKRWIRTDIP